MNLATAKTLLDGVPMATILIGADHRVRVANQAATALFALPLEGRAASAILRHPDFLNGIDRALAERVSATTRIVLSGAGHETHLALTFTPVTLRDDRAVLVAFEDQSALEHALAMRRDFVANVSHELRTPLTALIGFIDTLRGPARDDAAARDRFLGIMDREAGRMIRLVNDLLSLSRVESTERRRPSDNVDLGLILRGAILTQSDLARAAGVELRFEADAGPLAVRGDADQLTQVFLNLIENAVKYGASGKAVVVRLSTTPREPVLRGPAIQVEVEDYGDGIDPLHLPRLTERFYRVDSHRSREQGGTGLGLAIVKHIVNRHRGRLKIESEVGKGSRFIVILPAA